MSEVTLGSQIKKLRQSKKMTLAVMAERIGVTISAVAAYENGSRNPSFDVLIKIASLFHVTVDYLLGYSDRDLIDVTELSSEQKNILRGIISTYRNLNEAMYLLHENDLYITEDPMLLSGSIIPHYQKSPKKDKNHDV